MKKLLLLFFVICLSSNMVFAKTIKVGGYFYPPFVQKDGSKVTGIGLELLKEMNKFQNKYNFKFVTTSSKRRYIDFGKGRFDMIMFEDIAWGWKDKNVVASKVILRGGEKYVAKASSSKDQSFFNNIKNKSLALFLGYHYGFANYNADEKFLKKNFKVQLSTTHEGNIKKVLLGRADISLITYSYLKQYMKKNPSVKKKLLISDKFDQKYNHTSLIRKNGALKISELNGILTKM